MNVDSRKNILWTQIETLEANVFSSKFENDESLMSGVSPILLILGYGYGVQVWFFIINYWSRWFYLYWFLGPIRTITL